MNTITVLMGIGRALGAASIQARRVFGLGGRIARRNLAYDQLMRLPDRQLEDIGMTRGLIETVVLQGPDSVSAVLPEGAIRAVNRARRTGAA